MSAEVLDTNLQTYDREDVAAHYGSLEYLSPCERLLFETYISRGGAILDLGVGGGRTTPYLAEGAARYVGIDYADAMVKICRVKFPRLEFLVADAADLSMFGDESFDSVVFAFNGIDYLQPDQRRQACLRQIHRVLKPCGSVIFSSHNPRSVVARPSWNEDRVSRIAGRWAGQSTSLRGAFHAAFVAGRIVLAYMQAVAASVSRVIRRVPRRAFWRGQGYWVDSAHGGLQTHYAVPSRVFAEGAAIGLKPVRLLGDDFPRKSHLFITDWYYYVFTKPKK